MKLFHNPSKPSPLVIGLAASALAAGVGGAAIRQRRRRSWLRRIEKPAREAQARMSPVLKMLLALVARGAYRGFRRRMWARRHFAFGRR